jgi:ABC-type transport system involved in cytochrome c biogenesis ATPase subunit
MAEYIVTLADGADVARVSDALARAGLSVRQVLAELSIVTGEADAGRADALRAVAGVIAVETGHEIRLPPPDDPLQ